MPHGQIKVSAFGYPDIYLVEQGDDGRFYITSKTNGYNGYEGEGYALLEDAIRDAKFLLRSDVKDYDMENKFREVNQD